MKSETVPWWLRVAAALLAVPQLAIGLWAVLTPRGWYDEFPGWGSPLVSAEPPFNQHLVSDTGSGFLAIGVVLGLAAVTGATAAVRLALVGLAAATLPHLVFHAAHPSSALSGAENAFNVVVLGATLALPLILLVLSRSSEEIA